MMMASRSGRARGLAFALVSLALLGAACATVFRGESGGYGPGRRVLLDAHNSYPERGKYSDRIDRALATGLPVAIEQDLYWVPRGGGYAAVVAHDGDATADAPTMERYFFDRIRPLMDSALVENRRETWPLIVLNLDFKMNQRELHEAVLALLGRHSAWLTTAVRTATPDLAAPLRVGPLLVLSGQDSSQRVDFHDRIPVGERISVFGAIPVPAPQGATREARAAEFVRMAPESLIAPRASNYARWVNFPWQVVETGGQNYAGDWTAADSKRLGSLVGRAHAQGLWIRFYTLDGYDPARDEGLTTSYNFGSETAVAERWRAAVSEGVDFIATDHYERFDMSRRRP